MVATLVARIFSRLCNNVSERSWWPEQGSAVSIGKEWAVVVKAILKDKSVGYGDWIQVAREVKEERLPLSL